MSYRRKKSKNYFYKILSFFLIFLLFFVYLIFKNAPSLLASEKVYIYSDGQTVNRDIIPFGFPVASDSNHDFFHFNKKIKLLNNKCYNVGYSEERGNPLWVTYRLTRNKDDGVDKRQTKFITDTRTSAQIVHEHYNRSGYDRGHMAPNHAIGALCDDEAQKETFFMTNISPQSKALNQRWWERLERVEFIEFTRIFNEVWVVAGPVFSDHPVNLPNGPVQLPSEFYKIYLAEKAGQWHALAFLVEQGVEGKEPLSQYRTSIVEIEAKTGLEFFPGMKDDMMIEIKRDVTDEVWRLNYYSKIGSKF